MALDAEKVLSTLVGDVAVLRSRVEGFEALDVNDRLQLLDQGLLQLVDQMGTIARMLDEAQQEKEETEPEFDPTKVPDFLSLNQKQAAEVWEWLVTWCLTVLRRVYLGPRSGVWRPCWYQHRRVVIELIWACAFWHWSYAEGAPPSRAAEWHTRWLPHLQEFLAKQFAPCGAGETYTPGGKGEARVRTHRHPTKHVRAFQFPYTDDYQPEEPWEVDPNRRWHPTPLVDVIAADIASRPLADPKTKKGTP